MAHNPKRKEDELLGFPSPYVSAAEKQDKKYGLRYLRAMYSRHLQTARSNSSESRTQRYTINRKYAEGLQSVQKYKDLLPTEGDVSYLNLDWSSISVIPKFVNVLVGGMTEQTHKIQCNAIDPVSLDEKDEKRRELMANLYLRLQSQHIEELTGTPIIPNGSVVPESSEELDLYLSLNHKQSSEIAMEQALEYIFSQNDWDEIKRQVIRDCISLKVAGIRVDYDANNDITLRSIDPVNLIVTYSRKNDYSSIQHVGEVIYYTVSELGETGEFTEEQLFEIAKMHAGDNGNRRWSYGDRYYYSSSGGFGHERGYDDFLISVLDAEVFSVNKYLWEKKSNNYGGYYFQRKEDDYKLPKKSKQQRELIEKEVEVIYTGKWVIGSDYIFDWGLKENMIRDRINGNYSTKTSSSFVLYSPDMYDMENKSLVEMMIPFADQMQIAHLKIQQLIAKARPPGIAMDISAIQGVMKGMGMDGMQPLEIQNIFDQIGNLYYSSIRDDGTPITNTQPIIELQNGISTDLEKLIYVYNHNLQMLRDVTGINEARDASTPDSDSLVGLQKLALNASNNATRFIKDAYLNIIQRAAKHVTLMVQDNIENGISVQGYVNAIGEQAVKAIELSDNIPLAEFGIKIEALPDDEEKALIEQNIQTSIAQKELRLEDAIEVRQLAKRNTKLANQMLILRRRKYQQELQEQSEQQSKMNAEAQAMAAQAAAEAEMQSAQVKSQMKVQEISAQAQADEKLEMLKHQNEMKQITLKEEFKKEQIQMAMDAKMDETTASKESPQPRVFPGTGL